MRYIVPGAIFISLACIASYILLIILVGDVYRFYQFKHSKSSLIHKVNRNEIISVNQSKGGARSKINVSYVYKSGGTFYESKNISIHKHRDNFDNFTLELHKKFNSNDFGSVFYLTKKPSVSVIDNVFRIQTFFPFLFAFMILTYLTFFFLKIYKYEYENRNK